MHHISELNKQVIIHHLRGIFANNSELRQAHLNQELLNVVFDHCFSISEIQEIKDISPSVYDIIDFSNHSEAVDIVVNLIASKKRVTTGFQVNILMRLMRNLDT